MIGRTSTFVADRSRRAGFGHYRRRTGHGRPETNGERQRSTRSGSSRPSAIELLKFCLNSYGPWPTEITPQRSCPVRVRRAPELVAQCILAVVLAEPAATGSTPIALPRSPKSQTPIPVIVRHDHWLRLGTVPKRFPTAGERGDDPQTRRLSRRPVSSVTMRFTSHRCRQCTPHNFAAGSHARRLEQLVSGRA